VDDSKKISSKRRAHLFDQIKEKSLCYAFGIVDQKVIDNINILQATLKAMRMAYKKLSIDADHIIIDGNKSFNSVKSVQTIVKGDSKSFSIAAASILAKVKRDEIMTKASRLYPQYAWDRNKGYGTREHINAIKNFGYTNLHRKSFLRKILYPEVQEELLSDK